MVDDLYTLHRHNYFALQMHSLVRRLAVQLSSKWITMENKKKKEEKSVIFETLLLSNTDVGRVYGS